MKKYRTEKEILLDNQVSLVTLERGVQEKQYSIEEIGELLPGMLHLNRTDNLVLAYFNTWALNRFEKTVDEILAEGMAFMLSLFEKGTAQLFSQSLISFINENDNSQNHGFFQKLRFNPKRNFEWVYTSSKLFNNGQFTFSYTAPLGELQRNNKLLLKTLDDNLFLRKNFLKMQALTKREKQILQMVAKGFNSAQIAEQLFISKYTVTTHRRNIIQKLDLKNCRDWTRYANAF